MVSRIRIKNFSEHVFTGSAAKELAGEGGVGVAFCPSGRPICTIHGCSKFSPGANTDALRKLVKEGGQLSFNCPNAIEIYQYGLDFKDLLKVLGEVFPEAEMEFVDTPL